MEIEELIAKCIKHDRKAQEGLYSTFKNSLFSVCLKYCRSNQEAEDHLHDVFIEIFSTISNYKGKGSFEGWMKRIAINKAIDKYKKNKSLLLETNNAAIITDEIPLEEQDLPPTWEELISLIQQLPDQYRMVFNLFELEDYSHQEIAGLLKISTNTSKSNLHRARAILKNKILESKNISSFINNCDYGK